MARTTRRTVNATSNVGGTDSDNSGAIGGDGDNSGIEQFPGTITIDPASIGGGAGSDSGSASDNPGSTGPKRRGRKPGSAGTRKAQASLDVNGIEALLLSVHGMLAGITHVEELGLSQPEAKQLAVATSNVARHYDVTVSAKALDWTNLMMALGMVYGTRFMAIRQNRMNARANRARPVQPAPAQPTPADPGFDISTYVPGAGGEI